jgi:site-specific DNA-methyltransferase (adenine-specific)
VTVQTVTLRLGDCVEVLAEYADGSLRHFVCDPPYGLEFMGKKWDKIDWTDGGGMASVGLGGRAIPWPSYSSGAAGTANATCSTCGGRMRGANPCKCEDPEWKVRGEPLNFAARAKRKGLAQEDWHVRWLQEVFRVLPEGGVLKAFSGSRTFHRLGMAMERVGFADIRMEAWLYGQGMPKSTNISKSIDKLLGAKRKMKRVPYSPNAVLRAGGQNTRPWMEKAARVGYHEIQGDEPASPEAQNWDGWGTGLKPSWEPVLIGRKVAQDRHSSFRVVHVLRKPLSETTITRNVLKHGTGALNIEATRIRTDDNLDGGAYAENPTPRAGKDMWSKHSGSENVFKRGGAGEYTQPEGRWPSNVILRHLPGCRCVGVKKVQSDGHYPASRPPGSQVSGAAGHVGQVGLKERFTNGEKIPDWECEPGCPIPDLDRQSGNGSRFYLQLGDPDETD